MKSMAPSSSRCAERRTHVAALATFAAASAAMLLAACATPRPVPPPQTAPAPSFACDTTAQEIICSNETLAKLDIDLSAVYRRNLRRSDAIGREQLIAAQNRWLIGRASACAVPTLRVESGAAPRPALLTCLLKAYAERIAVLRQWPQPAMPATPATPASAQPHPVTAYVEFRQSEYSNPQTCGALADAFNGALRTHGDLDPGRIPGMSEIAGSHGEPRAQGYSVDLQDAGPYAGYALRAHTLKDAGGRVLIDEAALGHWVRRLPNHGGRASSVASQTGDYGSIDVFRSAIVPNRPLVLVAEPWGRFAPGAQGEWAFAGVYQIGAAGVEPLCLYRTYMTPPLKNEFERLAAYDKLQRTLAEIHGPTSGELVGRDLHDEYLFRMERQWLAQNMPLLAVADAQHNGWTGWLRKRHDAVLDALFGWSERSLRNKRAYRPLLALLPPAAEELVATYQRTQRLSEDDARLAANLVLMRLLADYASDLPGNAVNLPNVPLATAYTPKYPILASDADVQRDRSYTGLYSAALNGADAEAIADYIKYEAADRKTRQTRGAEGETALMAAVESPEIVRQLLAAGFSANETDLRGRTPLMNATLVGQAQSAQLLIQAGARIGARSRKLADPAAPNAAPRSHTACDLIKSDLRAEERAALQGMLCNVTPDAEREEAVAVVAAADVRVGDRWKFEERDSRNGNKTQVIDQTIVAITPARIDVDTNEGKMVLTPELNIVTAPAMMVTAGEMKFLSFPLEIGKKWPVRFAINDRKLNYDIQANLEANVVGYEKVRVAAGEFDAFRIEYQGKMKVDASIAHVNVIHKGTAWYAPAARVIVKNENANEYMQRALELTEFKLQP